MDCQNFKSEVEALIGDLEAVVNSSEKVDYSWSLKDGDDTYEYHAINVIDFDCEDGIFVETEGGEINIGAARIKSITRTNEIDAISYTVDCGVICYHFDFAA